MPSQSDTTVPQKECSYKILSCLVGADENGRFMRCDDPMDISAFGVQDSGHNGSLHRGDKEALGTFLRCWPKMMKENVMSLEGWRLHSMNGPARDSMAPEGKIFTFAFEKCWWKTRDGGVVREAN